jgi:hypothetical protein
MKLLLHIIVLLDDHIEREAVPRDPSVDVSKLAESLLKSCAPPVAIQGNPWPPDKKRLPLRFIPRRARR